MGTEGEAMNEGKKERNISEQIPKGKQIPCITWQNVKWKPKGGLRLPGVVI